MPPQKEFISAGNPRQQKLFSMFCIAVGVLGAYINVYAFFMVPTHQYDYLMGSLLLLVPALGYRLTYFIALEFIMMAGHSTILLGIGPIQQMILPILLSLQLLIYYWLSGALKNIFYLLGVAGIALLSIGFAYAHSWVLFLGSLFISIFSLHTAYMGKKIALIWAGMNIAFMGIILMRVL